MLVLSVSKGSFFSKGKLFLFFLHVSSLFRGKMDEKQCPLFHEVMSNFLQFSHLKPNETVKVAFSRKGFQNGCFFQFFIPFPSKSLSRKIYLYKRIPVTLYNSNLGGLSLFRFEFGPIIGCPN